MKALKAIMVIMGLMIVTLMVLIVFGFYKKATDPDFKFFDLGGSKKGAPAQDGRAEGGDVLSFGDIELAAPPGSRIVSSQTAGGDLVLTLEGPQGSEVVVVDLTTGQVRGRIRLSP